MVVLQEFLKTMLTSVVALIVIILLVWIPRELTLEHSGYDIIPVYQFSKEQYFENMTNYLNLLFCERSLGENKFGSPVHEDLSTYFSRSLLLVVIAFSIALCFGTLKGFFDYRTRKSHWRIFGNHSTFLFQSFPDFFVIIIFQMLMLYLMGKGFPHLKIFGYEGWQNYLVAGAMLAIFPTIYFARITFTMLMKEEGQPYLITGKSKGLTNLVLLYKHQFANSIYQIVPHIPTIMLYVLSNLLIIEYLMYFRGAGLRLYDALGFAGATIRDTNRTPFNLDVYEPEVVIALFGAFITIVAIVHLLSKVILYWSPVRGGEKDE